MDIINRQDELMINAGWVNRAKLILTAVLLVLFSLARITGFLEFPLWIVILALIPGVTFNLPHHWLIRKTGNPELVFTMTSVIDVFMISVGAYALGDFGKFLALLIFPLVFIFAGVVMAPRKTYLLANQGCLCLALLTWLEYQRILPPVETLMLDLTGQHRLAIILVIIPLYNFMAYFVRYLAGMLRKRETQLVDNAFRDEITGLSSRELFMERLRRAMTRTQDSKVEAGHKYSFAVLFLDLDGFKMINNSFGHSTGDKLLVSAARRLEACVKSVDTVARMGGDEFTVLLENLRDENVPSRVAERIQEELSLPFDLGGQETFVSTSIGIALNRGHYLSAEDLLRDAHTAMYRAKAKGRGRHEVFDVDMRPGVVARMELETDLRKAVEREEFCLYYQPIVALATEALVGFEALIRWNHPTRGLILPNDFIAVAEEIGVIMPIGQWVMKKACQQLNTWHKSYARKVPLSISVNLSGEQFKQANLHEQVAQILKETGVEAQYLKFEITESVLIENPEAAILEIARLKDMRIQFYMDDFGTGYSSLSYLCRFNVDKLKIDRSFVSRIELSARDLEIVRNIILLAHGLDMHVIAEGVETAVQLEHLKKIGCDYGQGFYFCKPLDVSNAEEFITKTGDRQIATRPFKKRA